MDKDVVHRYNRILLSDQKELNLAICNNMDGIRMYYAKQNKSFRERQIYYFTHMWNLRNKTDEHMERRKKGEKKRGRETNQKRLLMAENKLRIDGGRQVG